MSDAETPPPAAREKSKPDADAPKAAAAPAPAAAPKQLMPPHEIPDFEERKLSSSELREVADSLDVVALAECLIDGRAHVRINAARAIAVAAAAGADAAVAVPSLGLLLRDSVPAVRRDVAIALGKIGAPSVAAAPQLVGALGDSDSDVADEAAEALAGLGAAALDALIAGLDAGDEQHGRRVALLIGKQPNAVEVFTTAFTSPAVNVQVNSAIGLGLLGSKRIGAGLQALLGARTGGDGRTREAVRRALAMLEDDGPAAPSASTVDGFEDQLLTAAAVDQLAAKVQAVGVDGFVGCLQDGRDLIRANAATAIGSLGAAALAAVGSLGALLRDDSSRVRLAAAAALDRIGDAAVVQAAADLVGALRSAEAQVAEACAKVLAARKARVMGALVRGLETDDETHARRILTLINVFPDASEILVDAFASPAVNVQVNAAMGLGMLGPDKVGKGRKALEGARTGGFAPTREAVRKALAVLDGPQRQGPIPSTSPASRTSCSPPRPSPAPSSASTTWPPMRRTAAAWSAPTPPARSAPSAPPPAAWSPPWPPSCATTTTPSASPPPAPSTSSATTPSARSPARWSPRCAARPRSPRSAPPCWPPARRACSPAWCAASRPMTRPTPAASSSSSTRCPTPPRSWWTPSPARRRTCRSTPRSASACSAPSAPAAPAERRSRARAPAASPAPATPSSRRSPCSTPIPSTSSPRI